MIEVSSYIENLVNSIDNTIVGKWSNDEQATLIECKNFKWLRVGKTFQNVHGAEFRCIEINESTGYMKSLKLNPAQTGLADGVLTISQPLFKFGTKIATNNEWTIIGSNVTAKTPLFWLLDNLEITRGGRMSNVDFECDLRFFILDETDIVNYYVKDHVQNVVVPMSKLADIFMEIIKGIPSIIPVETYIVKHFTRFGVETQNGFVANILDANLSGVELRFKITKLKENCKC
jgi:hypothetical protein